MLDAGYMGFLLDIYEVFSREIPGQTNQKSSIVSTSLRPMGDAFQGPSPGARNGHPQKLLPPPGPRDSDTATAPCTARVGGGYVQHGHLRTTQTESSSQFLSTHRPPSHPGSTIFSIPRSGGASNKSQALFYSLERLNPR